MPVFPPSGFVLLIRKHSQKIALTPQEEFAELAIVGVPVVFSSGIPHPHLLGDWRPRRFLLLALQKIDFRRCFD